MSILPYRFTRFFRIALINTLFVCIGISLQATAQGAPLGYFKNGDYFLDANVWMKVSERAMSYEDARKYCEGDVDQGKLLSPIEWTLPTVNDLNSLYERGIYIEKERRNDLNLMRKLALKDDTQLWVLYDPKRIELFPPHTGFNIPGYFSMDSRTFQLKAGDRYQTHYAMCVRKLPTNCESLGISIGEAARGIGQRNMLCSGKMIQLPTYWKAINENGACKFSSRQDAVHKIYPPGAPHGTHKTFCSSIDLGKCAGAYTESTEKKVTGTELEIDACECTCKSRRGLSQGALSY